MFMFVHVIITLDISPPHGDDCFNFLPFSSPQAKNVVTAMRFGISSLSALGRLGSEELSSCGIGLRWRDFAIVTGYLASSRACSSVRMLAIWQH